MMSTPAPAASVRALALLACAFLGAACSTSPTTGRTQFNILPERLETAVPDLRFEVHTLLNSKAEYCPEEKGTCPALEQAERLSQRVAPIAELLGTKAVELSPELGRRVPLVEVFVLHKDSPSVTSSAGGRIAVSSALAQLDLSDADLALALAREFGRLAAAHHRESTSAGLAVSLVAGSPLVGAYLATSILADILFPMGTLFKLGISLIGSMGAEHLVEISQQEEADDFAGKLMLAAGYELSELTRPHPGLEEGAMKIGWLPRFVESRTRIARIPAAGETLASAANGERETEPERQPVIVAAAAALVAEPPPERAAPDLNPADAPLPEAETKESATPQAAEQPTKADMARPEEEAPKSEAAKAEKPTKKAAVKKAKKQPRKPSKAKKNVKKAKPPIRSG